LLCTDVTQNNDKWALKVCSSTQMSTKATLVAARRHCRYIRTGKYVGFTDRNQAADRPLHAPPCRQAANQLAMGSAISYSPLWGATEAKNLASSDGLVSDGSISDRSDWIQTLCQADCLPGKGQELNQKKTTTSTKQTGNEYQTDKHTKSKSVPRERERERECSPLMELELLLLFT